jgi:hypothetical protein
MTIVVTPALYSFSGPRASKKEAIFHETRRLSQEQYPDQPLVFLDDVVPKKPHPLDWDSEKRERHPTSRLLDDFGDFNEACIRKVRPAIEAGKVVITLRYGLDVYLNAIALAGCPQAKQEVFDLHHKHLVPSRIIQGTPKPQYFIRRIVPSETDGNVYRLHACDEMHEIEHYFDGTGQNPPIYLSGGTVRECAEFVLSHIVRAHQEMIRA